MIKTVDNFIGIADKTMSKSKISEIENFGYACKINKTYKCELNISLKDYISKSSENTFFSFFSDDKKNFKNNDDELIISITKYIEKKSKKEHSSVQTGNYIGKFLWSDVNYKCPITIDIKSRFNNKFLERMLNFANDVFLDDVSVSGIVTKNNLDISKFIIYYMFIQKLEKAFLLGIPKSYRSVKHHELSLKGKIDINKFIKYDIPFKGKISSTSREQKEIQEILDVLYKAIEVIGNKFPTKNISNIKTHLKQNRSNKYVSSKTINKAIKSKALQNPIFTSYKKVLEYAKFIIDGSNLEENKDGAEKTYGFLVNVSELFEIYITKLLQKEFPDWYVSSPKIRLDKEFDTSYLYARKIIPDICMIHENTNDVLVFDTKYKRMKFMESYGSGSDVDRCDFFQINTYMNYYHNQEKYTLKAGGLLYPIEKKFDINKAHSNNWFGNSNIKFIIDGIDLSSLDNFSNIYDFEKDFIKRINSLL